MPRSHFNGLDHGAAINGSQLIPDPPVRSAFNGGGGSDAVDSFCADLDGPGWSAQIHGLQWKSDPPLRSAFNGGGGGPSWGITQAQI
jgi:hypothetical protein